MKRPEFIVFDGKQLPAAVCRKCRGKITPAAALRGHLRRHRERDYMFDDITDGLRRKFNSMKFQGVKGL